MQYGCVQAAVWPVISRANLNFEFPWICRVLRWFSKQGFVYMLVANSQNAVDSMGLGKRAWGSDGPNSLYVWAWHSVSMELDRVHRRRWRVPALAEELNLADNTTSSVKKAFNCFQTRNKTAEVNPSHC